jgi:hypothetical protein
MRARRYRRPTRPDPFYDPSFHDSSVAIGALDLVLIFILSAFPDKTT